MPADSDLAISLYCLNAGAGADAGYGVELRFTAAGSDWENIASGRTPLQPGDPEFLARDLDPAAYGEYLAGQLLAEAALRSFFDQALAAGRAGGARLHVRLHLRPDVRELGGLRWETLRLPGADGPLLAGGNPAFSRYLDGGDLRALGPRSAADVRALVAVADPADASAFGLAPVDADRELAAANTGLGDIPMSELAARGMVTLAEIVARLRDGCDILYLVAHGVLKDGEPWLFLERADGAADRVSGRELAARVRELDERPRLAVLVSCQSAGAGLAEPGSQNQGALAAAGPLLAAAGVPAVVAMQGRLTMDTAAAFLPVFFAELRRDGLADRALAVARGAVRGRPDWWMPVLFTPLKTGRVWDPAPPDARPVIPRQPFEPETVYVRAGTFLMGAEPDAGVPPWETPPHPVTLPAFRIGRYPVTNREYAEFLRREGARDVPADAGWFLRQPPAGRLAHPVTGVSWLDAVAYCRWLSRETGRRYRLPTEAEWERAASWAGERGSRVPEGSGPKRRYPWGDAWAEDRCNASGAGTLPVTAHPSGASPCGCEDMLGNVQEWTATLWGTQPDRPEATYENCPAGGQTLTDPAELPPQARLVHRGGSYRSRPPELACTARGSAAPDSKIPWRGFRVAMEV